MDRKTFINRLETEKDTIAMAIASCLLLTPYGSKIYEEAEDKDALFEETFQSVMRKMPQDILYLAIDLGITE